MSVEKPVPNIYGNAFSLDSFPRQVAQCAAGNQSQEDAQHGDGAIEQCDRSNQITLPPFEKKLAEEDHQGCFEGDGCHHEQGFSYGKQLWDIVNILLEIL